jgi:hypothetical protein
MHAELSELARNRACSDIVLVTGDGDLLPGMMAAKEHGVAVHLWAVQAADGDYNQSEDLVAEADERRVLDRAWITRAVQARDTAPASCAPPTPRPEIAAILAAPLPESQPRPAQRPEPEREPETSAPVSPAPPRPTVPTPKDLASLGRAPAPAPPQPAATLRWSSDRGLIAPSDTPADAGIPTLAQLTSPEQRWADREEDITAVSGDPFEVGQVFARRWITRISDPAHLAQVSAEYPRVPHRIDGELLRYAARFGLLTHKDDVIDENDRYAIRAGFWREIDARVAQ